MSEPDVSGSSRRVLLACAGAACVAVLGGCARYDTSNGGIADGAPQQGSSASAAPPAAPASSNGPPALASTADIPVGGGKVLTDKKIVITQPQAGSFGAFTAVCTHQGCVVGTVSGGTINCPCHGSRFSITDGSVVNGPATTALAPVAIKVRGTSILPALPNTLSMEAAMSMMMKLKQYTSNSRPKRLVLSAALVLGTLGGLTATAPAAFAGSPQISAVGGPGEIMVTGSGFNPNETVRLEALTPALKVLQTVTATTDSAGYINDWPYIGASGRYAYIYDLGGYTGNVYVAADGAPGPTAWAKTTVSATPTFYADFFGCPYPPGHVVAGGYGFQAGDTVRLELMSADASWEMVSVMDTVMASVDNYGNLVVPRELNVAPGYAGHAYVIADEYWPGGLTTGARLDYIC